MCGLAFGLVSFGQNRISLSDAIKVDLPDGMQKINTEEAASFAGKQFNNEPVVMRSIAKRKMDNMYRSKNVLVSLHTTDIKITDNKFTIEGHLAQLKKGFDEWHKRDSIYSSKIETINNNSVLVENYIFGGVGHYYFFLFNKNNTRALTGVLEFNNTDKADATSILNHILQTVSLKD